MPDRFYDQLETQLLVAERRMAPARRRWPARMLRRGVIVPVVIAAGAVPALAATQPWDEFSGPAGSQKVSASAPIPGGRDAASDAPAVGVITYRSRGGLVCLAGGLLKDGRVGRPSRHGFQVLDAADAPGSCGDFVQNLADFGGIALGHEGGSERDLGVAQSIVFGLVASRSTAVRVTWRDGRTDAAVITPAADPAELQGAEGTFAVAGEPGTSLKGARVELLHSDGTLLHAFEL